MPLVSSSRCFSLSPSVLIDSGVGAQDPAGICPDPRSASHAPVACQCVCVCVCVLVQEIKDLCATWPDLCRLSQGVHTGVCACACVCVCVHALWRGKAVERGWALVSNDVLGVLIKFIIIATNPPGWVI